MYYAVVADELLRVELNFELLECQPNPLDRKSVTLQPLAFAKTSISLIRLSWSLAFGQITASPYSNTVHVTLFHSRFLISSVSACHPLSSFPKTSKILPKER